MELRRAIWFSSLGYIISFVISLIPVIILKSYTSYSESTNLFFGIGIVTSSVLAAIISIVYFRGSRIKPSTREGLYFGMTMVFTGFVFDIVLFILSALFGGSVTNIFDYYSHPLFWVAVVFVVITCAIIGKLESKKR